MISVNQFLRYEVIELLIDQGLPNKIKKYLLILHFMMYLFTYSNARDTCPWPNSNFFL